MESQALGGARGSVCVLSQALVAGLLRRYLDAGGRAVWLGDLPPEVRTELGLEEYAALPASVVELPDAGRAWGLPRPDVAARCIHVSQATTVLSRAGDWHACAYFKNFAPAFPAGGLLKLKAGPFADEDIPDLLRAAVFGL